MRFQTRRRMNNFLNKVLVATDGSEDASLATRAAIDLANQTGSELHLVHVWQRISFAPIYVSKVEKHFRVHEQQAVDLLEEEVKLVKDEGGTLAAAHLREGRPTDEIIELAKELDPDLLVLGSRGLGKVKRLVAGSVSDSVAHLAPCPTLVVRGGEKAWPPSRIIVGDDSSKEALRAGELAVSIGKVLEKPVILVRVYHLRTHPKAPKVFNAEMASKPLEEVDESLITRAKKLEQLRGMRPEIRGEIGYAASVLQELSEEGGETTLVAVGSRGFGAVRRFTMGSTSAAILRSTSGPVLVCPPVEGMQR